MKTLFKIIGIIAAILILGALIFYLTINNSKIPSYDTVDFEYTAETDSLGLVRGKKMVSLLCAGCHANKETGKLTGAAMTDAPAAFGKIYAPNITQDKQYGIGEYTDAELLYLLRTGIKKNGQYAPAYMAKLPHMADADMAAIIAFLKSDDPMVMADPTEDRACEPAFLTKFLCKIAWKPYPMPEGQIPLPDTNDVLAVGKYFTFNLECFSCHSESFETNDYLNPEKSKGYLGGGNQMMDLEGNPINASNISPSKEYGIGSWSKEQFINAVKYGSMNDEAPLQHPMQPYVQLTDEEAGAIYQYIMNQPAVEIEVERLVYN